MARSGENVSGDTFLIKRVSLKPPISTTSNNSGSDNLHVSITDVEKFLVFFGYYVWQDMFSPYLESFTPAFCAEAAEAESVD